MDNTSVNKCRTSPKNRNIRSHFSLFFLRNCLDNSGHYIIAISTSNAICSIKYAKNMKTVMPMFVTVFIYHSNPIFGLDFT